MESFNGLLTRRMEQLHLTTSELAAHFGITVRDAWDIRRGIVCPSAACIARLARLLDVTTLRLQAAVEQQKRTLAIKAWD